MPNIWKLLDDIYYYIKNENAALKDIEAIEEQMKALLEVQERRVEFYDFLLDKVTVKVGLRRCARLRRFWRGFQNKYKEEERSIVRRIRRTIKVKKK